MENKVRDAIRGYLETRGYEIISENKRFFVIYDEEYDEVSLTYYDHVSGLEEWPENPTRDIFETDLLSVVLDLDEEFLHSKVICSHITLRAVGKGRALVRHEMDCL